MTNPLKQILDADLKALGTWLDELPEAELKKLAKGGKKSLAATLKSLAEVSLDQRTRTANPAATTSAQPRPLPPDWKASPDD